MKYMKSKLIFASRTNLLRAPLYETIGSTDYDYSCAPLQTLHLCRLDLNSQISTSDIMFPIMYEGLRIPLGFE